ncbi:MAG: glycosyltransferase family 2 protein [Thermosynechococcaceae cyanobacterium MS004]|nr:glycosyltransferase family 2 protein [Thermosynechococcaceae cyanobacterium MS004]
MSLDIVLATYNGDRFLDAQIKSILAQDYPDWRLLIRDDGSCDRTHEIIQTYLQREPHRLQWIDAGEPENVGVTLNFNRLLEQSSEDYTFLCDQDDSWLPHKISNTLETMQRLELQWGAETPILVHSDLSVANEHLEVLHSSFWRSQNLDPACNSLQHLLIRNHITGCTVLINKALRELALPIPKSVFMHDWWLGLVAAAFGQAAYLKQPTVLYRQHQHNQVGAHSQKLRYIASLLQRPQRIREYYRKTQKQARVFFERYGTRLSDKDRQIISTYIDLEKLTFFRKRQLILQHGLFDTGLARNLALLSLI